MARHKPHKQLISAMKERYFSMKSDARRKEFTKNQEVDLAYLQDEIERRWFRFFADHYIMDTLNSYCDIVENAPLRKAA